MMAGRRSAVLALLAVLSLVAACSRVSYEGEAGQSARFKGSVAVVWLDEGDRKRGDGLFL